jgi:hypothetical protein|tara:strand:+ start:1811 stop:2059 length:249 start_codon:yes stop_codon:yes gene_type:complete
MLEKIIGATITEMACIGSITSVKSPIAEEGKPRPKKPFINPDIKKVNIKNKIRYMSKFVMNSEVSFFSLVKLLMHNYSYFNN